MAWGSSPRDGIGNWEYTTFVREHLLVPGDADQRAWLSVLQRRAALSTGEVGDWMSAIAMRLLAGSVLYVAGIRHRLTEVEVYYHSEDHPDPFTHCDTLQKTCGRWYFHRVGRGYRGGSFKGVDISFGDVDGFGGILIRGIEREEIELIDGPSTTVDHILQLTRSDSVRALDSRIAGRRVWNSTSPLSLAWTKPKPRIIYRCPRVGLSLRRLTSENAIHFLMKSYRFLTEPRRIRKGKSLLALGMHVDAMTPDAIASETGCAIRTVSNYISDFRFGQDHPDMSAFFGQRLTAQQSCRLYGAWWRSTQADNSGRQDSNLRLPAPKGRKRPTVNAVTSC